ncbi:hypothetical protein D9M69_605630 [compost metagenome]
MPTTLISALSLIRLIHRLAIPAIAYGAMIGSVTRRNSPKPLRPNALAASIWPKGIAWIAARKISEA